MQQQQQPRNRKQVRQTKGVRTRKAKDSVIRTLRSNMRKSYSAQLEFPVVVIRRHQTFMADTDEILVNNKNKSNSPITRPKSLTELTNYKLLESAKNTTTYKLSPDAPVFRPSMIY